MNAAGRRIWLCDLDGTLVDSAPAHEAAFRHALAEQAPGLLGSFRYADFAGLTSMETASRLIADLAPAERLARRKQEVYRAMVAGGGVTAFPGARRLLDRLSAGGREVYLVTGGSRRSVERVLASCAMAGAFHGVLTADDVAVSKPDPGFYLEACRRWSVDPAEAVAVEDSVQGVASAVGAGLLTLQVHTGEPAPGAIAVPHLDALTGLLGLAVSGAR